MPGSKLTVMTSEEMRAAVDRGEDRSDWERVRREAQRDPVGAELDRRIGERIAAIEARKRGRPVEGEARQAISLRVPVSVLEQWKATGPGWQTRMTEALRDALRTPA
ncbi:BrnA antitoxin family protein [Xylophilus sp.]|uniref:BrnA antitoxin family protein n=1 Tax=Xylophilus sp. TaxID=2653893 RepID=UPI0013BE3C4A|nr:BrnA antitoxin family protein [Xylophilus sp.]KAF1049189.1 MAG: hypothetical protein GAK38_00957 [Xylophilus sp.]